MDKMTIGRMARLNHISEQTLRLYDRMGLLSPVHVGENGYRYYDMRQCAQMDMIQYMKSLGMSLKDIKMHMEDKNIDMMKSVLRQKSSQIERQIRELKYQRRAIERTLDSFEQYENAPRTGTILTEFIRERQMYCVKSKENFYDYGIEMYEKVLRQLKDSLMENQLPQIYFCNAGSIVTRENILKRNFYSEVVFVFVDQEYVDKSLITRIPSNTYLCIYCEGFEQELEYADRLLNEVEEKGYVICGDYICEVISEIPLMEYEERGMFLRLQVPIKYR